MKDLSKIPEFSNYFRIISSSEFTIDKEKIFYRDKYNDIINYIKVMLTNNDDVAIQEYIKPKGTLLININPGTDVIDFIKLVSNNYNLDIIELDFNEIMKSQDKFLNSFDSIMRNLGIYQENEESEQTNYEKNDTRKLIIINQESKLKHIFQNGSLLQHFIDIQKTNDTYFNFLNSNLILIWINYDLQEIEDNSYHLYNIFDLFIKIPRLNDIEREAILRNFLERNPKIVFDINLVANFTENWEVLDLNNLLRVGIFKHFLNSEFNDKSNEITDILIDLIESGEYIPSIKRRVPEITEKVKISEEKAFNNVPMPNKKENNQTIIDIGEIINDIQHSHTSEFMLNQLYENAASKNYSELVLIIDKLKKKDPLEDNDRKLLAKYPFILNDSPSRAQINLEKAKKRIDQIKQVFGKR